MSFNVGDVVRIKGEWCSSDAELSAYYIVLEDWGTKVKVITKSKKMALPLVNVLGSNMIYKIGTVNLNEVLK